LRTAPLARGVALRHNENPGSVCRGYLEARSSALFRFLATLLLAALARQRVLLAGLLVLPALLATLTWVLLLLVVPLPALLSTLLAALVLVLSHNSSPLLLFSIVLRSDSIPLTVHC
jgi:hypothetical protein